MDFFFLKEYPKMDLIAQLKILSVQSKSMIEIV